MTPQTTIMVLAPIKDGQIEPLRSLLAGMNTRPGFADPDNALLPFRRLERVHVARLFVLTFPAWRDIEVHGETPRAFPPSLVLLCDIDGDRASFFDDLVQIAAPGLRRLFGHCQDFPETGDLTSWLRARNVVEAANYVNMRGRTVRQVHEEAALHNALSARLPQAVADHGKDDPAKLYDALVAHVREEQSQGRLPLTAPTPTPALWFMREVAHLILVPLGLILISPLVLIALPFLYLRLRALETSDPEVLPRPDTADIVAFSAMEDHDITNPFSAAGDVKPGAFRRNAASFFLYLLDYSARHVFGRGYLTRVKTIHFARWVFLEDKRRMLFCSNYDGSLESYMDDFINKVAWGLNLVFSNGVGYPATRNLVKGGAEQEEKFKRFLRRHQIKTDVWYKAYPGLTAFQLAENSRIRQGLERRPLGDAGLRDWLARL